MNLVFLIVIIFLFGVEIMFANEDPDEDIDKYYAERKSNSKFNKK